MKAFSQLSEFLESETAQGELEKFYLTTVGRLFIGAITEYALHLDGNCVGTPQDGARAVVDKMLDLTFSRVNASKQKETAKPADDKRPPVLRKQLHRLPPTPPASRKFPQPEPIPPVLPPKT